MSIRMDSLKGPFLLLAVTVSLVAFSGFLGQSEAMKVSKIIIKPLSDFEAALRGDVPTCCPESPTRYCDFYFQNYLHIVPNFHIKDGGNKDREISPVSLEALNWKGTPEQFSPVIYDSKTKNPVLVSSSWMNGTFLQCPDPLSPYINCGNQFYVTGNQATGLAKLHVRQFQRGTRHQHGRKFYYGRCILLPLTRISIMGTDIELDHEDGNGEYPESRRCVVFRTRP